MTCTAPLSPEKPPTAEASAVPVADIAESHISGPRPAEPCAPSRQPALRVLEYGTAYPATLGPLTRSLIRARPVPARPGKEGRPAGTKRALGVTPSTTSSG